MAISANVVPGSYPSPGRLKDGTQILQFQHGNPATPAQKIRIRFYKNTLLFEKQEPAGGEWVVASSDYLMQFRAACPEMELNYASGIMAGITTAKLQSLGLAGGPIPLTPTNEDIPYEIDANLKISYKALPTDSAKVVEDVANTTKAIATSLASGNSANTGTTAATGTSSTRNVLGYVLIGVVVIAVVAGGFYLVKKLGKKKR